ncbi:MAG: hypothetical protein EXR71_18625 [Myxococcales bacterium]|nr:hypothetical protein [Myxococcales bacterium]
MLGLLLIGCIHRVEVTTLPEGAMLYRKQTQLGAAPVTVRIPMFSATEIEARMTGYRTVTSRLRGVGMRTKGKVELRLVPEHGPVGTWEPDAVP